jgi:hypothetical protein
MFTIERNTEAWNLLVTMLGNPDTYSVSLAIQDNRENAKSSAILLKRNQDGWTYPLPVREI